MTPRGRERLEQDQALLSESHPDLAISVVEGRVEANGPIDITVGEHEICLRYQIRLVLPDNYPETAPDAYDSSDAFEHVADRHFYSSGKCCLWVDVDPQWSSSDPGGLARFVNEQVAVFFLRQWLYDQGQGWKGPEHSHGWLAYVEYAIEKNVTLNQLIALLPALRGWDEGHRPCPCGSSERYWLCHREFVVSFRQAGPDSLEAFLLAIEGR
jgi:hypothetical protein